MPSPAIEDYLKAMYEMERACEKVTTSGLAVRLGVQPASVTGMLRRLSAMELVVYTPYGAGALTREGRRAALSVIRHHRVIERFLVDALGFSWDQVHAEAHKLEHAMSGLLVDRLDAFLGHPATCPHGSPIPTADGAINEPTQIALADLPIQQAGIVSEVDDEEASFLRYLAELGLVPGAEMVAVEAAPFDGPIDFRVAGRMRSLGPGVTRRVWVQPVQGDSYPARTAADVTATAAELA